MHANESSNRKKEKMNTSREKNEMDTFQVNREESEEEFPEREHVYMMEGIAHEYTHN